MNLLALIVALLAALAAPSKAAPYFRPLDLAHPHLSAGAYVDPVAPGQTSAGTSVALITHSVADGCEFPTVVCMDWTPLAAGFSVNGGRYLVGIGPSWNLAPVFKAFALKGLNMVTKPESYAGLKDSLGSVPIAGPDVTMSFGPAFVLSPQENWKGYCRIFAGGMWRFGK